MDSTTLATYGRLKVGLLCMCYEEEETSPYSRLESTVLLWHLQHRSSVKLFEEWETKLCGCWQKEIVAKVMTKDITNQSFGRLKTSERNGSNVKWQCTC